MSCHRLGGVVCVGHEVSQRNNCDFARPSRLVVKLQAPAPQCAPASTISVPVQRMVGRSRCHGVAVPTPKTDFSNIDCSSIQHQIKCWVCCVCVVCGLWIVGCLSHLFWTLVILHLSALCTRFTGMICGRKSRGWAHRRREGGPIQEVFLFFMCRFVISTSVCCCLGNGGIETTSRQDFFLSENVCCRLVCWQSLLVLEHDVI